MQQLVDNRYRIVRPLGSGGMADVYLAHDNVLDRNVALKVMSNRYAQDEEFVERFKREAQSAAALSHPNIVSIYDRGESEDGTYYIAMEYLPGGTLKDRILKRGALPPRTAAAVALQIAEALRAAHQRGVIHRDIKPHNILITASGDVKVTDFGIARAASSSTMTRTGSILGTAHYISPEQAMGEPVGIQSDLYSLGVVLYEMLTGELPYDADTPLGIAMKHVNGHLRPPKEVDPAIPDGMNAICMRLLAKDPKDRYATDDELIEDLERAASGMDPANATTEMLTRRMPTASPTKAGSPPPRGRERRRRWLPLALALLALLILAPLAWAAYNYLQPAEEPPPMRDVPELVGLTLEKAREKAGDRFEVVREGEENSPEPKDTVLSQDPEAKERLREGSEISVTVASGRNEVPGVVGQPAEEAQKALEEAGFEVRVEEKESSEEKAGQVIDQNPEGGTADVGSEVRITVGTGPEMVAVPDIPYGYTTDQAAALLEESNLELGDVSEAHSTEIAEGGVLDQNPRPGVEVEEGSAVDITISAGPAPVEVPNVVGQDVSSAAATLASVGLAYETQRVRSNKPPNTVVRTAPTAGTVLEQGSVVTLFYSSGPPEPEITTPPEARPGNESNPDGGRSGDEGGRNNRDSGQDGQRPSQRPQEDRRGNGGDG
ncbi:MAG: Stk1 family PASTA domain-containing Ser/Thr kinase [Actinomycetota bacterium]